VLGQGEERWRASADGAGNGAAKRRAFRGCAKDELAREAGRPKRGGEGERGAFEQHRQKAAQDREAR
jgi:hypothetical protein